MIAALHCCDNTDMGDLALLFSGCKKQQIARVQFFDLYFFTHLGLGSCLAGQGNVHRAVGIGGKT